MNIKEYMNDVVREMRKVSWPKSKELLNYTVVVFITVIFMTLFFEVTDLGISQLIRFVLE